VLILAASRLDVIKPTAARISMGMTISGRMITSILASMLRCRQDHLRFASMHNSF
jgi:hypothetical protein